MAHLIHDQSHRLSEIITELMDFAKPVPPRPEETDVADLISRALHDAKQHTDPADRTIEVTMGDVPPVMVDPKQVAAAMTEVIDNALSATDPERPHNDSRGVRSLFVAGCRDDFGQRLRNGRRNAEAGV